MIRRRSPTCNDHGPAAEPASDDTSRTRFTDATSQIYRQESLFTPVSSVESSLLTGLHPSSLDSAFSDLHSLPHTVSLSTRFFSKSLGHSPSLGPHPSSLDSPIPDLHSVPSGVPWATPFKPRFSDPRSPLGPFSPLGRALAASILHSAISTPSLPPLGRALAASILHSAICTHSCCPLGRALAASILRSPICTRSVAPWAAPFHLPFSDLRSPFSSDKPTRGRREQRWRIGDARMIETDDSHKSLNAYR